MSPRFGLLQPLILSLLLVAGNFSLAVAQVTIQPDTAHKEIKVLGVSLDTLLQQPRPKVDTAYIASYYNFLHIHLLSERRDYFLQLTGQDQRLTYKPNGTSSLGVGVGYSWLSLDLLFTYPLQRQIETKGRTRQFGGSLSYNGRRFWGNTNYRSYRGLYLNNPDVLADNWFDTHTTYPLRPDMRSQLWFSYLYYAFNHRQFSNPASLFLRERQKKSAGSLLVGITTAFTQIKGDSSLFPGALKPSFGEHADLVRYRSMNYSLNVGYIQTLVFHKYFFTTASLRPGIALQNARTTVADGQIRKLPANVGLQGDARLTVGYSTDSYYGGVGYSLFFSSNNLEGTGNLRNYYTYIRFMVGRRFPFKPKGVLHHIPGF